MKRAGKQRRDQRGQQKHPGLPEGVEKKSSCRIHLV
jgi:hypothetical protein